MADPHDAAPVTNDDDWAAELAADQVEHAGDTESAPADDALSAMTAERDHYLDLARRTRADFENYQKRMAREMQSERRYAPQPFLADLLPVIDNLERALAAARGAANPDALITGVEMVHRQFLSTLQKHGVTVLTPTLEPFDPMRHEAMIQQPSAEHPPMTVLQTLQPGYQLHDRVIRPANVIVSRAAPAEPAPVEPANDDATNEDAN